MTAKVIPKSKGFTIQADEIGCRMNDNAAPVMSANVAALNSYLDTLKNPHLVKKPELIIPPGRLYTNDEIIVPPKTGILIKGVGSGLSYRAGLYNYHSPGQEGPVSTIINLSGDAAKGIFRAQGTGPEICRLKLQGREILTTDDSATGIKCGYGIIVEGNDFPPTGKAHYHSLTFVELGSPFYYPTAPDGAHGDTTDYGKMMIHGCDNIMKCENEQSIGHNFYGMIEFLGDGINGAQIGFDMYKGGDLTVANVHWNTRGGSLLKLRSGSYSQFNNSYKIGFRLDTPIDALGAPVLTNFCALDMSEVDNNDYPFHVRLEGSLAGYAGQHYTASNLIKLAAGQTLQDKDISHDIQVTYPGALPADRNAQRALHSTFNSFRYPMTPYHDNEIP